MTSDFLQDVGWEELYSSEQRGWFDIALWRSKEVLHTKARSGGLDEAHRGRDLEMHGCLTI
jgi:hypothetical protein